MNAAIASLLIAKIEAADLPWVDVTAGLVRPITFSSKTVKGKTFTYPIGCDVTDPGACDDTSLAALLPDEDKRSVLFIDGDSYPQRVTNPGQGVQFVSRLRIVVWLNCSKLGGSCNCGDLAAQNIIAALRGTRYNASPYKNVLHRVIGGGPSRGTTIFSSYTFDEKRSQYLHYPFDFFALDIETSFTLFPGCEDILAAEDAACWTPPPNTGLLCKRVGESTAQQVVDCIEAAGLTDGVEALICTGGSCPYDGVITIDGVPSGTFGPFDPCEDNTLNINITYS